MPLRHHLLHLRADGDGEFIVDYYHDYCKTTVTILQFNLPNTLEQTVLANGTAGNVLQKSLREKMAVLEICSSLQFK